MTATTTNSARAWLARGRAGLCLGLLSATLASPVRAENVLQDIQFVPGSAGDVDITLTFSESPGNAEVFTTDDPPRIAIDLPDTRNAAPNRRISVGSGSTSAINAVEANGRTRVVVDLFRASGFESRTEGNRFVLSVSGGSSQSASAMANSAAIASGDPAKRVPGALEVQNIDFRRSPEGAGRVIVTFSQEGAASDFDDSGEGVTVAFDGAGIPDNLAQRIDVTDFATPVQTVELRSSPKGAALRVATSGEYEALAYQTGRDYILELAPPKQSAEIAKAALAPADEDNPVYTGTPVTFNFQDIPVRTVLQLIAEESALNIVAADTVTGNVTLRLVNVPWDQALDIVLRAKSLDKRRSGNVAWIAPQKELADFEQAKADARLALEQRAELVTEFIPVNYGNAEEIANLLTEEAKTGEASGGGGAAGAGGQQQTRGFLSPRGSVSFDKRTNTLLINDSREKITELRKLITLLDRPVDQVLIEARIVIAAENFSREIGARFGISAGYEDDHGNILSTSGTISSTDRMSNVALINRFAGQGSGLPVSAPFPIRGSGIAVPAIFDRLNFNLPVLSSGAGSVGLAILGADYLLDLELSALETDERGELVSSPRVITANQREANIKQGVEVGYVTILPAAAGGVATPNVQFKKIVLELNVTPTITQDGRVYLAMKIIKDELAGFVSTTIGDVPQVNTREINTAVLVDDSQTVVIGGVYEFAGRDDLNKIPFFGDLPLVGNAFRNKFKSTEKAELLIFVTPRVLSVAGAKKQ